MFDDLENILDTIVPDDNDVENDSIVHTDEFTEMVLILMEDYIMEDTMVIADPNFHNTFINEVIELVYVQLEDKIWMYNDEIIENAIENICYIFYETIMPCRSYPESIILNETLNTIKLTRQINILRRKPQPVQRTKEWYEFRHNLITASNAYKGFTIGCELNQLIFEKCKPLYVPDTENASSQFVNVDTTLHWGQKYEPISVLIYEDMYNTKIEEFGCIRHEKYPFLGASPDGINIDNTNSRYGRMLEIKNIVNREIDGIPKLEYWVQMQLQMETCDLSECDFLETKIIEYENENEYENDNDYSGYRGIIMYFSNDGVPEYKYAPLNQTKKEFTIWENKQHDVTNKTWIKNIYWKAEHVSCVLVLRNELWFKDNISTLKNVWDIIEKERISGCDHRAPMRRVSNKITTISSSQPSKLLGCLLPINKDINSQERPSFLLDFKIRTESFDDTKIQLQLEGSKETIDKKDENEDSEGDTKI